MRLHSNYLFSDQERENLEDPLVANFLNDESNYEKFLAFIESPNPETKTTLDSAFKSYYKNVKVTSYINKLIHFFSIDLDKKKNKYNANNMLILDRPIGEDGNITLKENLPSRLPTELNSMRLPLEELLENLELYEAWTTLSLKQKKILRLKYQYNLKDVEIAATLSETKQVISYNHKKAIQILRDALKDI